MVPSGTLGVCFGEGLMYFAGSADKLRETAARAKIVSSAVVLVVMLRGVRVYEHSTHGVSHAALDLRGRVLVHAYGLRGWRRDHGVVWTSPVPHANRVSLNNSRPLPTEI